MNGLRHIRAVLGDVCKALWTTILVYINRPDPVLREDCRVVTGKASRLEAFVQASKEA